MERKHMLFSMTVAVMALLVAVSLPALAAKKGGGGQQAVPYAENSFSGFGTFVSMDGTAGTVLVKMDKGSRLLKNDLGTEVTFHLADDALVFGFGKGHEMGGHRGGKRGGKGCPGKAITLAEIEAGDSVMVAGTYDSATDVYTVNKIKVWLY